MYYLKYVSILGFSTDLYCYVPVYSIIQKHIVKNLYC